MDIETMHIAVKLGLDKSSSLDIPAYEPEEIDYWLNKAIFKFVKTRYSGMNVKRESFEQTQKRTDDLSTLVKYAEIALLEANDYPNSYTVVTEVSPWYLPSLGELKAMRDNLYAEGLGGFTGFGSGTANTTYWSSTEDGRYATAAWGLSFGSGTEAGASNTKSYVGNRMRAARHFTTGADNYQIGSVGPSGGYIFYVDGATHYEAYPTDWDVEEIAWSDVIDVEIGASAQGTAIGTGLSNTLAIIAQTDHTESAAQNAYSYESDDITDLWPSDYLLAISEEVNSDSLTKRLGITQCTHDRYRQHIDDPYSEHILHYNNAKPLRLFDDDNVKIITDGQYTLDMYYLTYIRMPATVDVDSTPAVDCDLPEHTHEEIVNITVNMMLENIEQPRYQSHSNEIATME